MDSASIVILSGLVIGLVYGSVGLLSGFCLMSGMRGWLAEGDGRLIRTYALAIGVAVAVTQLLAAAGLVDIGKSIYLQPSFSVPVMFFGGLPVRLTAWCCRTAAVHARWCCSGAAISVLSWWSSCWRFSPDDAEGPDRAAAHCHGRCVPDHDNGKLGAGAARGSGPEC
jgi:hypothetical protein